MYRIFQTGLNIEAAVGNFGVNINNFDCVYLKKNVIIPTKQLLVSEMIH